MPVSLFIRITLIVLLSLLCKFSQKVQQDLFYDWLVSKSNVISNGIYLYFIVTVKVRQAFCLIILLETHKDVMSLTNDWPSTTLHLMMRGTLYLGFMTSHEKNKLSIKNVIANIISQLRSLFRSLLCSAKTSGKWQQT